MLQAFSQRDRLLFKSSILKRNSNWKRIPYLNVFTPYLHQWSTCPI